MSKSSVTIHQAGDAWVRLGRPRVSLEQLRLGMEVEQEHTDDLLHAAEIAVDHLSEFGDYYTRLVRRDNQNRFKLCYHIPATDNTSIKGKF